MEVNKIDVFNMSTKSAEDKNSVDETKFNSLMGENYNNFNSLCSELNSSFKTIKNIDCVIDFETNVITFAINGTVNKKGNPKRYDYKF